MTTDLIVVYGIIYKCTNLINGKIYIGQTKKSLQTRRRGHENLNGNLSVIQRAIKKYGKENFKWEIIDSASNIAELNYKEKFYIIFFDCYCCTGKGYNIAEGGYGYPCKGKTELEILKIRKKQSDSHIGNEQTPETIEKIRKFNINKILITNGSIIKKIDKHETLPDNFLLWISPWRNTIPITNGSITKRIDKTDTIPDGFKIGTSGGAPKGFKTSEAAKLKQKENQLNRIRYTNGINNKYIKIGCAIPEGYYVGYTDCRCLTKEDCLNKFASNKDTISITNEIENKRIYRDEVIPEGWRRGQCTKRNPKYKCIETGKTYVYISDICRDINVTRRVFGKFDNDIKLIANYNFIKI